MIAPVPIATSDAVFVRCARLRCRRFGLWLRDLWRREVHTGAAISDAEFDHLTLDGADALNLELAFYDTNEEARELTHAIDAADVQLSGNRRWRRLVDVCSLSDYESRLLLLAVAHSMEPELGRAYAYLQDQTQAVAASGWLAARLWPGSRAHSPCSNLVRWTLAHVSPDGLWHADEPLAQWLDGIGPLVRHSAVTILRAGDICSLPNLYPGLLAAMCTAGNVEIELLGPKGSGRRTLAAQFAFESGLDLLCVDETKLAGDAANIRAIDRAARLLDAIVYWQAAPDSTKAASLDTLPRIVARELPAEDSSVTRRSFELPPLTKPARLALWVHLEGGPVPQAVEEWTLSPAEIVAVCHAAEGGEETIRQACRKRLETGGLLSRLPCPYEPEDLVLSPAIRDHLSELEAQIRLRGPVYEEWGFDRLVPLGRGILALFAGPSGTGKTMAAQVLARSLGRDLYRLDLANVVNKYIGETEKRLKQVFDACDRSHAVLLIDECDALFGQRMTAKDAHDRYANIEIDYLLQRVERFEGIGILATNRKNDLDPAFLRRIRMIIDFLQPGPKERAELWRKTLLPKSPAGETLLDEIDFEALAQKLPLTGAEIKLAALGAAFLAKNQKARIGMQHVMAAARREMSKRGTVLRVNE